jgi:hypothetical protein
VTPVPPTDLDAVVRMIAAEQVRPERNVPYVGTDVAGIRAELDALEPPWSSTVRVVYQPDGSIVGASALECDADLGRARLYGPWIAGDDTEWATFAPSLFDAGLAQLPEEVDDVECCAELANTRLQALAATRGWTRSNVNHGLETDAATVGPWTMTCDDVRPQRVP